MTNQDQETMLTPVLRDLFSSTEQKTTRLQHGLALAIKPNKMFRAGRIGKYPSATEIKTLVREAHKIGVNLHQAPKLFTMETNNAVWCVAEWNLEVVAL